MYDPPAAVKKIFPGLIWNSRTGKVLLTFDDGPLNSNTEAILAQLDRSGIRAVFFCVGNNIAKNPELAKEIISGGHMIGNHTYNHKVLFNIPSAEIEAEIQSFNRTYEEVLNAKCEYFRPPHGRFGHSLPGLLKKNNMTGVMWSLLTRDYKNSLNIVKFAVEKYLRRDSVIVLHDSLKSKDIIQDSIKFINDAVKKKDFEFGEPSECLK